MAFAHGQRGGSNAYVSTALHVGVEGFGQRDTVTGLPRTVVAGIALRM
jgi:hypothetical protein